MRNLIKSEMSGKIAHKKNVGQMMGQISYRQAKKPCKSRLFPVDLDAPYRPLSHKNLSKHFLRQVPTDNSTYSVPPSLSAPPLAQTF